MKRAAIFIVVLHLFLIIFSTSALAFSDETHGLSLAMPTGYTELTAQNAEDHKDLLDGLGYTEESFLEYLKHNGLLVLAVAENNKNQITVKSWKSDFSKNVGDLASLDSKAINGVAAELITDKKLSYKTVSANAMKLIEIRTSFEDSGGHFSSIQYLTIRNGRFYSLIFTFPEAKLSDTSVELAWNTLAGFQITPKSTGVSFWDINSILIMILVCVLIAAAIVVIGMILFSFITDFRNRQKQVEDGSDISIKRRKF